MEASPKFPLEISVSASKIFDSIFSFFVLSFIEYADNLTIINALKERKTI